MRRKADVILVVGSRVGNLDVPFDKYWGSRRPKLIQVDVDPRHMGVSRPVTLGIVADARTTLEGLAAKLRGRKHRERADARPAAASASYGAWAQASATQVAAWNGPGIHPAQACAVVGECSGAIRLRRRTAA